MPAVESTIYINRTPHDIFAFVSDYERDPRWRSKVLEMTYQDLWALAGDAHRGNGVRTGRQNRLAVDFRSDPCHLVSLCHA